ncbi:hypothetical protein FQN51_003674 [Onygenales sp. PD_10]|nr:hypothetical protein FQN51_003674 [Onygenales sp. PD_10]
MATTSQFTRGSTYSGGSGAVMIQNAAEPLSMQCTEAVLSAAKEGVGLMDIENFTPRTVSRSSPNDAKSRRYEIRTLLDIGRRVGSRSDSSCFSAKTIDVASIRTRRQGSGSRILSEKSVNRRRISSRISMGNDEGLQPQQASNIQYPSRQPQNAPQGNLAQADAGFARFLKEHASPKHHRVTAGGRIVPMNLSASPAPEFRIPAKRTEQSDPKKACSTCPPSGESKTPTLADLKPDNDKPQNQEPYLKKAGQNGSTVPRSTLTRTTHRVDSREGRGGIVYAPNHSTGANSAQHTQRQPNFDVSAGQGVNVGQLTPESTSISSDYSALNGPNDQIAWITNGPQSYYTVPSSLEQPHQGAFTTQPNGVMYSLDQTGLMMSTQGQLYPVSTLPMNQTVAPQTQPPNLTIPSYLSNNPLDHETLEQATQEFDRLTEQLSNLDRYLALHAWNIDPAEKKSLIDQRVDLVMKLDAARSLKEQVETAIQSFTPRDRGEEQSIQFPNGVGNEMNGWLPTMGQYGNVFPGSPDTTGNAMTSMGMIDSFNGMLPTQNRIPISLHGPGSGFDTWSAFNGLQFGGQSNQGWTGTPDQIANNGYNVFGSGPSRATPYNGEHTLGGTWEGPEEHAPAELTRVYHDIEAAASRGEPLGPLFEELAIIARKLNVSEIIRSQGLPMRRAERSDDSNKDLALVPFKGPRTDSSRDSVSNNSHSVATPSSHITSQASGKKSNRVRQTPSEDYGLPTAGGKGEDDAKEQKSGNKNTHINKNGSKNKKVEWKEGKRPDSAETKGPRSAVLRDHAGSRRPHSQIRGQEESPTPAGKTATPKQPGSVDKPSGSGTPGKTATQGGMSRNGDVPFSPWKQVGANGRPQKSNTSTASHKVNAYGLLPRYDGAGDVAEGESRSGGNTGKATVETSTATSGGDKWYRKEPRKTANPMDVRAFFQKLKEEERAMIYNYRHERRPFG